MPQQFRSIPEPTIPTVYTNATRLMFGVYDFRLLFAEQMVSGDGEFVQVERVAIVMSPQHIKKLMKTVVEKLVEYESKFGPIPEEENQSDEEENAPSAAADEA
jgi:hypothetical protein